MPGLSCYLEPIFFTNFSIKIEIQSLKGEEAKIHTFRVPELKFKLSSFRGIEYTWCMLLFKVWAKRGMAHAV